VILFPALDAEDQDLLNDIIGTKMVADIDEGTDGDILTTYDSRFPRWTLLMDPDKCALTIRQLAEKALDYYHHVPTVLEMFVLVRSMEDWLDFLDDDEPYKVKKVEDEDIEEAERVEKEIRDLERLMKLICPKPELLYNVEGLINDALHGGKAYKDAGIKLEEYFDIIPPDIRARLEAVIHQS
jgi:hypothetical protein